MAKYLKCLFVALFATLTISLTSCSKDDDKPISGDIVGTWECVETFADNVDWGDLIDNDEWGNYLDNYKQYIRFSSDGSFVEVDIDDEGTEVAKGTWSQSGNKITIKGNDMISGVASIVELTSNKLVIEMMGLPMTYKKVADSTIDKYL